MSTTPSKLDMNTFQPTQIPIPQGATIGRATPTVPIPLGATIGAPVRQNGNVTLDFSKAQPLDMSTFQPTSATPEGFWQSVKNRLQFAGAGPMGQGDQQPQAKPSGPVTDNAWDQQKQVLKDSFNEMVDNVTHPSQLLHMLPGWDQIKDKITPKQIQQWQQGDKAGAAGTSLVDIGNLITGGLSAAYPEATASAAGNAAAATVRGTAKATNAVLHNAPDVIPSAFAPPIVKKLATKLTVPGEDFGIDYYDKSVLPNQAAPLKAPQTVNPVPQPPAPTATTVPTAAERHKSLSRSDRRQAASREADEKAPRQKPHKAGRPRSPPKTMLPGDGIPQCHAGATASRS